MSMLNPQIMRSDGNASSDARGFTDVPLASERGGSRPSKGGFARLGQKSMRHNSVALGNNHKGGKQERDSVFANQARRTSEPQSVEMSLMQVKKQHELSQNFNK